jgi:hypothetical protein
MFSSPHDFIPEYLESEYFLFLAPAIKEHAESALTAFCDRAVARGAVDMADLNPTIVDAVLMQDMSRLSLPVSAKRALPDLLEGFFGFLRETGRFPAAGALQMCAEALAPRFKASLREDGSVKGETVRKVSTEVGRNDPCFCGSGKKFKKCCGPMLGA